MPVENFEGNTFVAFVDISGFKKLMKKKKGIKALNKFYSNGYYILNKYNNKENRLCKNIPCVEGIFISDCGILFVRNCSCQVQINELLKVLKELNSRMIDNDIMLTTSIAYGQFKYKEKFECTGMEKVPIYGQAYVNAFIDAENEEPKMQSGQCRIVKNNLPYEVK